MNPQTWLKAKEILGDVLQVEPSQRLCFLDAAEITAESRREVESLLAFEGETGDFMSLPITDLLKDSMARADEESEIQFVGQKIGIYKIAREIGVGGMGAVYLARRTDGKFEREVAIKLLKREFNTEKTRRRFNLEKEIQAKLLHPNIAALLDAGTTRDGVPYLVMEYIEGEPIDRFCCKNRLSLIERLKLFNKACDAVAFAHQNLIIHRDLKPSNILVTPGGNPKLLDFGISKLLDAASGGEHTMTNFGAMTPQYASPEQIKGETVTTATDIYSLGVILFKILTGHIPYNFSGRTNGNLLREITNSEPSLPSGVYREEEKRRRGEKETGNLSSDSSSPPPLPFSPSRLKGDLDNIILKSLSKEPARRYKTVEQFSADIWRFIDGKPVLARPATFSYRASKFYSRNKIPVLAGVLILLSLIGGIAVTISQARAAQNQAEIASGARAAAELETARAKDEEEKTEKISRFMSKIISYANPAWYSEGAKFYGEAKVIDALNDMGGKIDAEFSGQPDIQAELHHKFAEVYNFNRTARAKEKELFHARRAIELRKQFYGERHELVAKDMYYLSAAGGVDEADAAKYLTEAIQMMRETNPYNLNLPYMLEHYAARLIMPDYEEKHDAYRQAVVPPTSENKYQIAERFLLEALPIFREHYKEDNHAIFANECVLAFAQAQQNKFAEAEPHYRICKESADKIQSENQAKIIGKYLSQVEEILAANNR